LLEEENDHLLVDPHGNIVDGKLISVNYWIFFYLIGLESLKYVEIIQPLVSETSLNVLKTATEKVNRRKPSGSRWTSSAAPVSRRDTVPAIKSFLGIRVKAGMDKVDYLPCL